jgi:hypothetical protein
MYSSDRLNLNARKEGLATNIQLLLVLSTDSGPFWPRAEDLFRDSRSPEVHLAGYVVVRSKQTSNQIAMLAKQHRRLQHKEEPAAC